LPISLSSKAMAVLPTFCCLSQDVAGANVPICATGRGPRPGDNRPRKSVHVFAYIQ
jgi:hypothetical protein